MKSIQEIIVISIKVASGLAIGLLVGVIVSSNIMVSAGSDSSTVVYDNSTSGSSATIVKDALDDLYNNVYHSSYIPGKYLVADANSQFYLSKDLKMFGNIYGLCIEKNNRINCFSIDPNDYNYEKDHIQKVFADGSCTDLSWATECVASDFDCTLQTDGRVYCLDQTNSDYQCDMNYGDEGAWCG